MLKPALRRSVVIVVAGFLLAIGGYVAIVVLRGQETFTIIAMPDTQYYTESHPDVFEDQVRWILDERERRNIVFVAHEGDIVEHYDSRAEWEIADSFLSGLDGVVAYSVLPGNHDMSSERDMANYNRYFPPERFAGEPWYLGNYPEGTNDNSYQLFSAGGYDFGPFSVGQIPFIVVNLEFCPTRDVLDWASGTLAEHPQRWAIVVTHGYLNFQGTRHVHAPSGGCAGPRNNTDYIFEELIYPNPNVFMVLSGHEWQPERGEGEAYRVDGNAADRPVHQILADYQGRGRGGDGWLRIIGFNQQLKQVIVRTYSPTIGMYERDEDSDFRFELPFD